MNNNKDIILNGTFEVENDLTVEFSITESNLSEYLQINFKMDFEIQNRIFENHFIFLHSELHLILKDLNNIQNGINNKFNNSKLEKYFLSFYNISLLNLNDFEEITNILNNCLPKNEIEIYYNGYEFDLNQDNQFHVDKCLIENVYYFVLNNNNDLLNFYCKSKFEFIQFIIQQFMKSFLNAFLECNNSSNNSSYEIENLY